MLQLPKHYDFQELRLTPAQTRVRLEAFGHANIVAFQTRHPLHRVHEELTKHAAQDMGGEMLLHPVIDMTEPGMWTILTRMRAYETMATGYYDLHRMLLALLP